MKKCAKTTSFSQKTSSSVQGSECFAVVCLLLSPVLAKLFSINALGFLVLASEPLYIPFSLNRMFLSQHHRIRLSLVMPHLQHFLRHPQNRRYWGPEGNLGYLDILGSNYIDKAGTSLGKSLIRKS